jgi:Mitochondrial carrier protein
VSFQNLAVGAGIQVFEVTTLGQPFEVVKTFMAANRKEGLVSSIKKIHQQGGMQGFWRGLIPWVLDPEQGMD